MVLNNTNWEIVGYVQLVFFVAILLALVVMVVNKWRTPIDRRIVKKFAGFFGFFALFNIIGAICGIILLHMSHPSTGLTIATYVFDNISLGLLIKSVLPFVELMVTEEGTGGTRGDPFTYEMGCEDQKLAKHVEILKKPKNAPFWILTLLITAAVICTIVGSSSISSNSGPSSPMKAGSILFLVSIICIAILIIWRLSLSNVHRLTGRILLGSIIFLIVRAVYSIITSFAGVDFEKPSKFLLIFGQYEYYTFMAFMQECIISLILLANFHLFHLA